MRSDWGNIRSKAICQPIFHWSTWNLKIFQVELHECEKLPSNGVQILYAMDNVVRNAMTWRLIIRREATEEDLEENHYLEEKGETLWETSWEIIHCPFCGKNLLEKKDRIYEDHGKFSHNELIPIECDDKRFRFSGT